MSKLCKQSRFQYWYHLVYTTLLITPYSFGTQSLRCFLGRPLLTTHKVAPESGREQGSVQKSIQFGIGGVELSPVV
jgi:hypothetical protein